MVVYKKAEDKCSECGFVFGMVDRYCPSCGNKKVNVEPKGKD